MYGLSDSSIRTDLQRWLCLRPTVWIDQESLSERSLRLRRRLLNRRGQLAQLFIRPQEPLEHLRPVVDRLELFAVDAVEALPAVAARGENVPEGRMRGDRSNGI